MALVHQTGIIRKFSEYQEELLPLAQYLNEELCQANEIIVTFQTNLTFSFFKKEDYYV